MRFLRTVSTRRLAVLCASAVAVAGGGTAIAVAGGADNVPPQKPLADAVHDGLKAPAADGITARVKFTNHLVDSSGIQGANPLLSGASGRLWLSPDRGFRLELQSENGDAQVVADRKRFWVLDGTDNTVYRGRVPRHARHHGKRGHDGKRHRIPSVARIQRGLDRAEKHKLDISGPEPGNIGGEPAYTVRVSPGRPGGLLGAVEYAWDVAHGLPLRVAVYARGNSDPVLELAVTEVDYGPVADSNFAIDPPADARVVKVTPPRGGHGHGGRGRHGHGRGVTGVDAVSAKLPFALSAPEQLAGLDRTEVRLLKLRGGRAALVTYGEGPGAIAVIERKVKDRAARSGTRHGGHRDKLELPTTSINGATATVLDTPLGSVVRFERDGVTYTVLGSVTAEVAKTAARGL